MKKLVKILTAAGFILILGLFLINSELNAQDNGTKTGRGFIDLNNDGLNDNALDSDKDGIPNCIDPDFAKAQNRRQHQYNYLFRYNYKYNFTYEKGNGYGPGNGMGNNGIGPRDGSGYGPGSGTGVCDGTGPKGRRGGRR